MATKNLADWITARKRHGLSHAHVQMARELGMNPNKLGKLDNQPEQAGEARQLTENPRASRCRVVAPPC